jgi:hypothetical protein
MAFRSDLGFILILCIAVHRLSIMAVSQPTFGINSNQRRWLLYYIVSVCNWRLIKLRTLRGIMFIVNTNIRMLWPEFEAVCFIIHRQFNK